MYRAGIIALTAFMLMGCGAETATTAATVGAAKKLEIEQGRKTMEQVQQKVSGARSRRDQGVQRVKGSMLRLRLIVPQTSSYPRTRP